MLKEMMLRLSSMFSKRELDNQIDSNLEMIDKFAIPMIQRAILSTNETTGKFVSKEAMDYDVFIKKNVKVNGSKTYLDTLLKVMEMTKGKIVLCQDILNKSAEEEILRESISVKNFNIVRMVEITRFLTDYTRKIVSALVTAEGIAVSELRGNMENAPVTTNFGDMTDSVITWLNDSGQSYITLTQFMLMDNREFIRTFDKMADIQLSPSTVDAIAAVNGVSRVNPFAVKGFSINLLPTLIFGEAAATSLVKRYDEAEAERMLVESTLLRLRRQHADEPDNPKLDYQISYYSARLDKVRAEIDRIEDKYNIGRG